MHSCDVATNAENRTKGCKEREKGNDADFSCTNHQLAENSCKESVSTEQPSVLTTTARTVIISALVLHRSSCVMSKAKSLFKVAHSLGASCFACGCRCTPFHKG